MLAGRRKTVTAAGVGGVSWQIGLVLMSLMWPQLLNSLNRFIFRGLFVFLNYHPNYILKFCFVFNWERYREALVTWVWLLHAWLARARDFGLECQKDFVLFTWFTLLDVWSWNNRSSSHIEDWISYDGQCRRLGYCSFILMLYHLRSSAQLWLLWLMLNIDHKM